MLFGIAFGVRYVGNRVVPLLMPGGCLRPVAAAMIAGLVGSWVGWTLWPQGPTLWRVHLVFACGGSILFYLAAGLAPFVRTLIGRP